MARIHGQATPPDNKDQITLHRVIDAIYQSAKEGRDVQL